MLNRTNLTLSALSNRLNLGTRSLVLNASVNNGDQTLRIRHLHHDVMRERMVWLCVVPSCIQGNTTFRPLPGSIIPGQQQRPIRCAGQEASRPVCLPCVEPRSEPKPEFRPGLSAEVHADPDPPSGPARPGTAKSHARPTCGRPGTRVRVRDTPRGEQQQGRQRPRRAAVAGG